MRIGGPLRGLVQGAERAAQDEARRAGGRRFLAALHGVQGGAVGAEDSDASSDKVRAHDIGGMGAVVGCFLPHVDFAVLRSTNSQHRLHTRVDALSSSSSRGSSSFGVVKLLPPMSQRRFGMMHRRRLV